MKTIILLYSVIIAAMVMVPFIASSQKVIDYPPKIVVICVNGNNRKPIGGVKVTFRKDDRVVKTCVTGGTGRCLILNPKPGNYYIAASKKSYLEFTLSSVDVPQGQTIVLEIPLESSTAEAQPAQQGHVTASLAAMVQGNY